MDLWCFLKSAGAICISYIISPLFFSGQRFALIRLSNSFTPLSACNACDIWAFLVWPLLFFIPAAWNSWPLTLSAEVGAQMQSKAMQALIHGCHFAFTCCQTLPGSQMTVVFTQPVSSWLTSIILMVHGDTEEHRLNVNDDSYLNIHISSVLSTSCG